MDVSRPIGERIYSIPETQLRELLAHASEEGARRVMQDLALDTREAQDELRLARKLAAMWSQMAQAAVKKLGELLVLALFVGLAVLVMKQFPWDKLK